MTKRPIYWLTDQVGGAHKTKGLELAARGFDVAFFQSANELINAVRQKRVSIIVIGDEGPESLVIENIQKVLGVPEVQGARFILTTSKRAPEVEAFAAANGCRDLIPLDIEARLWLNRFAFSTAGKKIAVSKPQGLLSMNQMCSISLPARVGWIGKRRIWIECRLKPTRGTTLTFRGALARAMGCPSLKLTVEETGTTNLIYRFSDAIIATWKVSESAQERSVEVLKQLEQLDRGPKCKVFVAVQNPAIRSEILARLDQDRFEINMALQKQSMIDEPRFFGPHIVIVEDTLCQGEDIERFHKMLGNLPDNVPVILLGKLMTKHLLQNLDPTRPMYILPSVPVRFAESILAKYLGPAARGTSQADKDSSHINHDHQYSIGEIIFSGRIKQVHPTFMQLAAPFPLGSFGLCKVEAPFFSKSIGFAPQAKVIDVYHDLNSTEQSYPWFVDCFLATLSTEMQRNLAKSLVDFAALTYGNLGAAEKSAPATRPTAEASIAIASRTQAIITSAENPQSNSEPLHLREPAVAKHARIETTEQALEQLTDKLVGIYDLVADIFSGKGFRYLIVFLAFSAFVGSMLWAFVSHVAPKWERSGNQYNDSLKRFAPGKFDN